MFFDNTLSVKRLARTVKLDDCTGSEKQLYNVGDTVTTSTACPYTLTGSVQEVYQQNGYFYYTVSGKTLRTKDIKRGV